MLVSQDSRSRWEEAGEMVKESQALGWRFADDAPPPPEGHGSDYA